MEDHFLSSSSSHFTNHFTVPDLDPSRRSHRHHSNGMVMGYDRQKKLQSDNEYLRERVKSCESGLGRIYQTIINSGKQQKSHKGSSHHRSASLTYQFGTNYTSPSPTLDLNQFNDIGTELDEVSSLPQVTLSELQSAVEKLLSERESLKSEVDDLKQITEAAKRERVLAIDEKDQLLRETHTLRVTVEASQMTLNQYEEERSTMSEQLKSLKEELTTLKRDNEQANQLRSRALEERSKIIEECASLQEELRTFQAERAELYEETAQLQRHMEDMGQERRRLEQELEWLSQQKALGYETEARAIKEQNEGLGVKVNDVLELRLMRDSLDQPWGFTVEGGRGTEFYHQDPSIVVTGVANHTPAESVLRFGDRILKFGGHNFFNMTRKEAVEKIRSCDLRMVSMEVGRASSSVRPSTMDVKVPGRRDFGFSYETRLFVTSTEEGSPSVGYLLPGDEIIQVQGKTAFNMKSSTLKQLLKSCKDGLTLTIHRQPGISPASPSPVNSPHMVVPQVTLNGTANGHSPPLSANLESKSGLLHPLPRHTMDFVQSPGTPKSNVSEMSMGYHSLTHSVPSEVSNGIAHLGHPELSVSESNGLHHREHTQAVNIPDRDGVTRHRNSDGLSFASPQMRAHTLSGPPMGGLNKSSYRSRPSDFYSPRRNTTNSYSRGSLGLRPRPSSNSIPKTSVSPSFSSRMENGHMQQHFSYPQKVASLTRGTRPVTEHFTESSGKPFSFSADNLDVNEVIPENSPIRKSQTPKHENSHSRDGRDTGPRSPPAKYSRGRGMLSISMGNMQTHV